MDLTTFASLATLISLLLGGVFAYLKFWRTNARQAGNDMYDRALRIIQTYEKEMERKDQEMNDLRVRLISIQNEVDAIKQRNAALVSELARAYNVPPSFVEMRLDGAYPTGNRPHSWQQYQPQPPRQ